MDANEIERKQERIKALKRRKHERELQQAMYGISGDPIITMEIEDLDKEIKQLELEISQPQVVKPPSPVLEQPKEQTATVNKISTPVTPNASSLQVTLDFQVQGADARILWRSSLTGREETVFTPPFDDVALPIVIKALDVVQYPNYPHPLSPGEEQHFSFSEQEQAILTALNLWKDNRIITNAYQIVGDAIYTALGAGGQATIKMVRNSAIDQKKTANYILRFPPEAINLAALPWELLWDKQKNYSILIRGNTVDSAERYVDLDMAIPPPLSGGQQLHLLALSPTYNIPDDIRQQERAARLRTWDKLKADRKITYDEVTPLTVANLNDYLLDAPTRPDVIHYFGHGVYRDGKGYLLFDNNSGGKELVSTERLAAILGDVRLVVIHACQSAMIAEEGGLLTGVAPALSLVTGAVVAMQLTVAIPAATRFSQVFYDQLLSKGKSLQESVARGRQILFTEATDGASWYVPTIYIRSREQQSVYLVQ